MNKKLDQNLIELKRITEKIIALQKSINKSISKTIDDLSIKKIRNYIKGLKMI